MRIHESDARVILAQNKIERDVMERRSCAAILMDMAMVDIEAAFDLIEASEPLDRV